ncbi:hypothetical protein AKJ65_04670 [candidate division MSBL1 archaeon SCGC-AAA259E19]|uniref:Uncharacterized protein n=1 Tax=candidate division MSBL1 archaeon SCGC-AAA259E19 TaxID=1698264 RepID=A0A133UJE0_9EURY|nr:hypothetical protein AKJ65_04670 [candidate division MSBL1 archaeon SCGC-AAA259E19]
MNLLSLLVENWIIVVPVVLFSFLVVLEECEEASESTVRTGGVPNSVLSEHMGSSFPSGFYTCYSKEIVGFAGWAFAFVTLLFVWVATNVPEMFQLGMIYAVLAIFVAFVCLGEIIAPRKAFFTAMSAFVGENVNTGLLLLMGLGIATAFVPLNFVMALGISVKPLLVKGSPALSLFLIGLAIPWVEEGTFISFNIPSGYKPTSEPSTKSIFPAWLSFSPSDSGLSSEAFIRPLVSPQK